MSELDRIITADTRLDTGVLPGQLIECVKCRKPFRREKTREGSRHCPECLGWLPPDQCQHHWSGDEDGMVCEGCGTICD